LWACEVGAPLTIGPFIVVNHTNNMREVLVQDSLHRIHLISPAGKLLWSRALDGPLLGTPHQVDRFKNGKLQLLLGTATTIHLIDRNGKDASAPKALPVAASAPIAVFDYDGLREYRVIAPLSDGRVLNLDLDGRAVQGWSAPQLDTPAMAEARHLRVAGKDYLLLTLADGTLKLLDRRGAEREKCPARLNGIAKVAGIELGQQLLSTLVVWVDQEGLRHATTLGGEERKPTADGQPTSSDGTHADLNRDGNPERISMERGGRVIARR